MESTVSQNIDECVEETTLTSYKPLYHKMLGKSNQKLYAVPGDVITSAKNYTSGHGTYTSDGNIYAGVAGVVQIVSSFLSVKTYLGRYIPYAGQMVIGRVRRVLRDRWLIDIGGCKEANLLLSSVNLPGSELRRRSTLDEMNMREHFIEGDLIYAEVQKAISPLSPASLQTRSAACGKLTYGILLDVPLTVCDDIPVRLFSPTPSTSIIVANNGKCWISTASTSTSEEIEIKQEGKENTTFTKLDAAAADETAHVLEAVNFLSKHGIPLRQDNVVARVRAQMEKAGSL